MKLSSKIAGVTAAAALALAGGSYATFTGSTETPVQNIASSGLALEFSNVAAPTSAFTSTYSNIAAGDSVVTFVNLKNAGTVPVGDMTIKADLTGDLAGMGASGSEKVSVKVDQVTAGADGDFGTADDVVVESILTQRPLADLSGIAVGTTMSDLAANTTKVLRFTATLDPAAVVQNKSITANYTMAGIQKV